MADHYPNHPGSKGTDGTSQDAADAIAPTACHLRRVTLLALSQLGEAPALDVVAITGLTRESIQPRLSELRGMGLVDATGARRRNPAGTSAAVLRLTDQGRASI